MSTKKCYDVSIYQKGLVIPADTHHVIIKLGQKDYVDGQCEVFIKQCLDKKINFDLYWYMDALTVEDMRTEFTYISKYFDVMCNKYNLNKAMHLWIDFERNGQDQRILFVRALNLAEEFKLNVGIYTCWDWYRRIIKDSAIFKDVPIWLAWWGVPTDYVKDIPNIHFHQYGVTVVDGYKVDADTELYCCDYHDKETEQETDKDGGVTAVGVPLYTSAYADTPVTTIDKKFYYYDNEIINGRRRITIDSFYVGKLPIEKYVTGWVDYKESTTVPAEGNYFTNENRNLFTSAYDVTPVGTTNPENVYYYYDNEIINGKRRVTIDKEHVGDKNYGKYVTGWVKA